MRNIKSIIELYFRFFKVWLFKYLFNENEKCILNQALNLQRLEYHKEYCCGLICKSDFSDDLKELQRLQVMCENKLWN